MKKMTSLSRAEPVCSFQAGVEYTSLASRVNFYRFENKGWQDDFWEKRGWLQTKVTEKNNKG